MAKYIQSGERIPRRGEVGHDSTSISKLEASGYVMSGARNAAMNAVRLKKENQVLSVEGRRQLAMEALQAKMEREEEVVKGLKQMLNELKFKGDQT